MAKTKYVGLNTMTELANILNNKFTTLQAEIDSKASKSDLNSHISNKSNPHGVTKAQIGLGNVENKSSATIRGELTKANVTTALGYTPPTADTHYASKNVVGNNTSISNTTVALTNGNVYLNSVENGKVTSAHKISGSGATTVTTDASGNIIISSTDNNTTYSAAGSSLGLVKSGGDVTISSGTITVNDDSHNHTIANIDSLQSSLDSKAAVSHNHAATDITSGTLSSDRLPTVPIAKGGTGATTAASALTNLGITATASELNKLDGVTATTTELNYVDGVTSNIQTQLNGKAASSHTHNVLSVQSDNYKQGTDLPSTYPRGETVFFSNNPTNKFNNMSYCTVHTIKGYNNMVCVQYVYPYNTNADTIYYRTALYNTDAWRDWKTISTSDHTHPYAGSSSVGGAATSANKLNTNAGDSNTPVYFSNGVPVACTSLDLNTSGSSASCTGNAATATKLKTARSIGLGTGVTGTATNFDGSGNITIPVTNIKESYLSWGGKNIAGGVSPIDAASSSIHSANRFAFAKPAGITIEYSTNGSTYSAYSTTDAAKINLVSGNGNTYYIGGRSTSTTVNDKLRITLNATNMGLYTRLRKLLINISTSYATGSNVIIEKAMKGSETTFTTIGTYNISGWSGWNSIPVDGAFGGGSNQTGNIAVLRLTFGITGVNSEQTSNALSISDIIAVGDTYWSYPSTMAKTGHLYTYDSGQNATFPAKVTATGGFSGSLSGNATSATTASACSGNSATATKLATARTISLTGDVTGSASFDGSANASITATIADDSHNHIISNVDGLQSALDGKSATSHNHNSAYISKDLQFTSDNGAVMITISKDDGKNILTEIENLPIGFYTIYSQSGTTGNPKSVEAWRFMVHKTGANVAWVQGYGSVGSVYTNYFDASNGWRGWKNIWDVSTAPLWSGQYYMSSPNSTPQTVTPSKKLSECRTGWLLLWSDYDAGDGSNDADFATTMIPKGTPSGGKWGGKSFLCDIPRYVGSNSEDVDTERRIIKPIYVHDDRIEGSYQNDKDERNDVVLRAVYEI